MSIKSMTIAAVSMLAVLGGAAGAANAGGSHHFGGHRFHNGFGIIISNGGGGGGCGFYREMWEETGLFKWKRRYYECKGWW